MGNLFWCSCKAGTAYFTLVFGAGFVMGAIRVPLLVPRLGERVAELIEMPFMCIVIILAARFIATRFALPPTVAVRLGTGFIALALLVTAEVLFVVAFQEQSLGHYVASRDPVSGSVYLVLLSLFAAMPLMIMRLPIAREHA